MESEKLPRNHVPIPLSPDRISHLPHALHLHILSFLPIKFAVQTCVLSKRWRYLWTSIPCLDFDAQLFLSLMPQSKNSELDDRVKKTNFMDFADKVLMLRDSSDLYKFRLSYSLEYCNRSRADIWIRSAVMRNVRELDLDITPADFEFPGCVFTSESLAVLKLDLNYTPLKLPTGVGFCGLKTLCLCKVGFKEQNLDLCSKCPLLEYLNISHCFMNNLNIFALKLKTLILDSNYPIFTINIKIRVSAPSLLSFKYIGLAPEEFILENLSSLVDAVLDINGHFPRVNSMNMSKIIQAVSKAQLLTLSMDCIKVPRQVPNVSEWLSTPNYNLKHLKLTALLCYVCDIETIACFLKRYINLEALAITFKSLPGCFRNPILSSPPKCSLDHLKEVEIKDFEGHEYQLGLVEFLLMNAKLMERMIIYTASTGWEDIKKRMAVYKKLLSFPKASSSVTMLFS